MYVKAVDQMGTRFFLICRYFLATRRGWEDRQCFIYRGGEGGLVKCYHVYRIGCGRESHDSRCTAGSEEMGEDPLGTTRDARILYIFIFSDKQKKKKFALC